MHKERRSQSNLMREKQGRNPQANIYNRHFYVRGAEHELRQAQHQQQIKQLANKPKITVSSYNILCQQLESTLLLALKKHSNKRYESIFDVQKCDIDFVQLHSVVCEMCQIPEQSNDQIMQHMQHFLSQLWLVFGQYQIKTHINTNIVYSTLRVFLDPYNLNVQQSLELLKHIPQFQNAYSNRINFIHKYPDLEDQTLTVPEIVKLWRKIRYANPAFTRLTHKVTQSTVKLTFKPEINPKSSQLASKSLRKYLSTHQAYLNRTFDPDKSMQSSKQNDELSRYLDIEDSMQQQRYHSKPAYHDILYQRKLQKDYMIPKNIEKEETFYNSRVSRTAKPQQIRQIVNNLYVVKQRNENKDFNKLDQEKQLKLCTFSPTINKKYQSKGSVSPSVKGYNKQVERLQKGREDKQKKRQAYENLGRVKNFSRNYSKSPNRSIAPSFIERDAPKLILQINIDGERVEKLALKGDENPRLVSKKFVIKHGLQQQMVQVLEALVSEQLKDL